MTLLFGEKGGWQSLLVSFLVNPWLGEKNLNYPQKYIRFPFLFLLLKLLLGNSAHISPQVIQCCSNDRSNELTHQLSNFGNTKPHFQTIIIEGGQLK